MSCNRSAFAVISFSSLFELRLKRLGRRDRVVRFFHPVNDAGVGNQSISKCLDILPEVSVLGLEVRQAADVFAQCRQGALCGSFRCTGPRCRHFRVFDRLCSGSGNDRFGTVATCRLSIRGVLRVPQENNGEDYGENGAPGNQDHVALDFRIAMRRQWICDA